MQDRTTTDCDNVFSIHHPAFRLAQAADTPTVAANPLCMALSRAMAGSSVVSISVVCIPLCIKIITSRTTLCLKLIILVEEPMT